MGRNGVGSAGPDSVIHLYHDQTSNAQYALRAVVRDSGAFALLWRQVTGLRHGQPPTVDFRQYMIIAAAMGPQGSTGHDITIEGVEAGSGVLRVRVRLTAPGAGCLVGGMITSPADLVRTVNRPTTVTFLEAFTETRCPE